MLGVRAAVYSLCSPSLVLLLGDATCSPVWVSFLVTIAHHSVSLLYSVHLIAVVLSLGQGGFGEELG